MQIVEERVHTGSCKSHAASPSRKLTLDRPARGGSRSPARQLERSSISQA